MCDIQSPVFIRTTFVFEKVVIIGTGKADPVSFANKGEMTFFGEIVTRDGVRAKIAYTDVHKNIAKILR